MGIYSMNRTSLIFTPFSENAVIHGYESPGDLFRVISEIYNDDLTIVEAVLENDKNSLLLEASKKGSSTGKNKEMYIKLWKTVKELSQRLCDKICSICTSVSMRLKTFQDRKVKSLLEKDNARFEANKTAVSSSKFSIRYDKALLGTQMDKEFTKRFVDTGKAFHNLIKNASKIAKDNYEEILKSPRDLDKISAISAYTSKFFDINTYPSEIVTGNPFKEVSPDKLKKDLISDKYTSGKYAVKVMNEATEASYRKAFKEAEAMIAKGNKSNQTVTDRDVAISTATIKILQFGSAKFSKSINDIVKIEKKHMVQNIKLYKSITHLKSVKHESINILTGTESAIMEADELAEELSDMLEL